MFFSFKLEKFGKPLSRLTCDSPRKALNLRIMHSHHDEIKQWKFIQGFHHNTRKARKQSYATISIIGH